MLSFHSQIPVTVWEKGQREDFRLPPFRCRVICAGLTLVRGGLLMMPGHIITAGRPGETLAWGPGLIDSDQMGVPTRCCTATEIAPRRLAAFLRNTLCTPWRKIYEFPKRRTLNPAFNIHIGLSVLDKNSDAQINRYQRFPSRCTLKTNTISFHTHRR